MDITKQINWDKITLIPTIAQDSKTNEVLMLAYMNEEALKLTLQTNIAHYYSRSKQRIWKKGETSKHTQEVKQIFLDCDNDTLLLKVKQNGVACHTGRPNCFFQEISNNNIKNISEVVTNTDDVYGIVDTVYHIIQERKNSNNSNSYVSSLFQKGENTILKKIVEEAGELCFAIKDNDEKEIILEATDLLFHSLVALGYKNISPDRIKQELKRRFGVSGIEEKNSRK
ncbi:MAG: Phosphoribosyl-AMP cyclohydrolase (EC / Phosphoribosyl-ATP pyrophosphatase (EC [uncultured Campylobacterales bacterium]|uniref:Histidine biosynthesis bifunctional protein HisIE n=1 Tax=uncultured Campylobacterales bacterium TaxID=352960 RepID=A0A6S6TGD4_9BACT|nr:MAG: Phosphoribosyl-AMP cyclohydrolase (EC / Phosphoribosyl-ATP pyrophosphatase (EC [uncultured Campylobacterales bacterium]